ncbi:MAG: hypothetical protein CVV64_16970, partial [Candidatus Wallbacteria bacterium HGW-Wallbacteria-1]
MGEKNENSRKNENLNPYVDKSRSLLIITGIILSAWMFGCLDKSDTARVELVDTSKIPVTTPGTIGSQGGLVTAQGASLAIPPGAVSTTGVFTLSQSATPAPLPAGLTIVGSPYTVSFPPALGASFELTLPATLSITVPPGSTIVTVMEYRNGVWQSTGGTLSGTLAATQLRKSGIYSAVKINNPTVTSTVTPQGAVARQITGTVLEMPANVLDNGTISLTLSDPPSWVFSKVVPATMAYVPLLNGQYTPNSTARAKLTVTDLPEAMKPLFPADPATAPPPLPNTRIPQFFAMDISGNITPVPARLTTTGVEMDITPALSGKTIVAGWNTTPNLAFIEPDGSADTGDAEFILRWTVIDPENSVNVALHFTSQQGVANGQPVITLSSEAVMTTEVGGGTFITSWNTAGVPEGIYYPYAILKDSINMPVTVHSTRPVVVVHPPAHETSNPSAALRIWEWVDGAGDTLPPGASSLATTVVLPDYIELVNISGQSLEIDSQIQIISGANRITLNGWLASTDTLLPQSWKILPLTMAAGERVIVVASTITEEQLSLLRGAVIADLTAGLNNYASASPCRVIRSDAAELITSQTRLSKNNAWLNRGIYNWSHTPLAGGFTGLERTACMGLIETAAPGTGESLTAYADISSLTSWYSGSLTMANATPGAGNRTAANNIPAANGPASLTAITGTTLEISGFTSTDADNDTLYPYWAVTVSPTGASPAISSVYSLTPSFRSALAGSYTIRLTVDDLSVATTKDVALLVNTPPIANAGTDQQVLTNTTVTLNGSSSSDPDGNTLTWSWAFESTNGKPANSVAALSGATSTNPTFIPDREGTYLVNLTVSDSMLTATDQVVIIATEPPNPFRPMLITEWVDGAGAFPDYIELLNTSTQDIQITADMKLIKGGSTTVNLEKWLDTGDGDPSTQSRLLPCTLPGGNRVLVVSSGISAADLTTIRSRGTACKIIISGDSDLITAAQRLTRGRGWLTYGSLAWSLSPDVADFAQFYQLAPPLYDTYMGLLGTFDPATGSTQDITKWYSGDATALNSTPGAQNRLNPNRAPTSSAGQNATVNIGSPAALSGALSSDPDGDTIKYLWSITSAPQNSTAAITSSTLVNGSLTPDKAGKYVLTLTVDDGTAIDTSSVEITGNTLPAAAAGADQNVSTGATVTLNGSASTDADGNTLTWAWAFETVNGKPSGSNAALTNAATSTATFTADLAGTYTVNLTVSDGTGSSTDQIIITATTPVNSMATLYITEWNDSASANLDYIEIHNSGGTAVNVTADLKIVGASTFSITDYMLANEDNEATQWKALPVSLPAGGYAIVVDKDILQANIQAIRAFGGASPCILLRSDQTALIGGGDRLFDTQAYLNNGTFNWSRTPVAGAVASSTSTGLLSGFNFGTDDTTVAAKWYSGNAS